MEDNKIIEDKKIKKGVKGLTFNEYHKNYYIEKISGCKSECECGLMVDKFRFAIHRKTKKHLKNLSEKNLNIELNKILE
jgi:hypothetical protein